MMEFVTSRTVLVVCGLILMTAVAVPMTQIMNGETDEGMGGLAAGAAEVIDRFWGSEMDEMRLRGCDMLPSPDCSLSIDGRVLTIRDGAGKEYVAGLAHMCTRVELGYMDTLTLTHGEDGIICRRTSPQS